jgi:hypothetical protein
MLILHAAAIWPAPGSGDHCCREQPLNDVGVENTLLRNYMFEETVQLHRLTFIIHIRVPFSFGQIKMPFPLLEVPS